MPADAAVTPRSGGPTALESTARGRSVVIAEACAECSAAVAPSQDHSASRPLDGVEAPVPLRVHPLAIELGFELTDISR